MPSPGSNALPETSQRPIYTLAVGYSTRARNNQGQSQPDYGTAKAGTRNPERTPRIPGPEANPILLGAPIASTSYYKRTVKTNTRIQ